jgi:hypothetical protein
MDTAVKCNGDINTKDALEISCRMMKTNNNRHSLTLSGYHSEKRVYQDFKIHTQ